MTTGNKTLDNQYILHYFRTNCQGGAQPDSDLLGTAIRVIWSGGDSPVQLVQNRQMVDFSYPLYKKDGTFLRMRRKVSYFPKDKYLTRKTGTDHPFSKQIYQVMDTLGWRNELCDAYPPQRPVGWRNSRPWGSAGIPNIYPTDTAWTQEDDYALYGKLAARLGSGFNLATFLGEGRESLATITTSATRIYRAYKLARKGKLGKAWNALRGTKNSPLPAHVRTNPGENRKNLASNWLQLQYGWLPLLRDIEAAAKHLAHAQNRNFQKTYRMRQTVSTRVPLQSGSYTYGGSFEVSKQILAKVTSINEARLIGLTDPRATAWELVPFSFVADWFIPIGNYLEALNLSASLSGTFVVTTKTTRLTTSFIYPWDGFAGQVNYFNRREIHIDRTVGSAMPTPQLPQLKPLSAALTFKHAVNAVALIVQKMRF